LHVFLIVLVIIELRVSRTNLFDKSSKMIEELTNSREVAIARTKASQPEILQKGFQRPNTNTNTHTHTHPYRRHKSMLEKSKKDDSARVRTGDRLCTKPSAINISLEPTRSWQGNANGRLALPLPKSKGSKPR
ncbi:hypothetical protein KCU72_g8, partial [Aureobasidium melanogenum]